MSLTIFQFGVWLLVWIGGCWLFDGVIELKGAWLMLAGALTYMACELIARFVKEAADFERAHKALIPTPNEAGHEEREDG